MTPNLSLYLDLLRFLAAMAVALGHLSSSPFTESLSWWHLNSYGDVAVVVFFVLSGYVIAFVTDTREHTGSQYFSARIARLYSVITIALFLTWSLDYLGSNFWPDFYSIPKVLWKPPSWAGYGSSFLFVNEYQIFNFGGISPGSNAPYWSLSFEATYYFLAGVTLFCRKAIAVPVALLVLFSAGRTITALLPLWLLGFATYYIKAPSSRSKAAALTIFFLSMLGLVLIPAIRKQLPSDNFGYFFPWGRAPFDRNLIADYITAVLFSCHLHASRITLDRVPLLPLHIHQYIRYLGGLTFPLYCFHYPVICFFAAASPWGKSTYANLAFIFASTMLIVVGLTPFCEKMKSHIKYVVSRAIDRSVSSLLRMW